MVKQLRHPNVIKYVDVLQVKDDGTHTLLATEPVTPLRNVLGFLDYSEILFGLYQIAVCLFFCKNL